MQLIDLIASIRDDGRDRENSNQDEKSQDHQN